MKTKNPSVSNSLIGFFITLLIVVFSSDGNAQTVVWSEDFESPSALTNWQYDLIVWEIGVPTNTNGPPTNGLGFRAFQGTNCAATGLTSNYPNAGRTSRLISPSFVVPEAGLNPRLRFWHWWSFYSSDYGQVQIKGTNNVWQPLSGTYNTSSSGRWSRAWLDMGQYAGQSVQLGFYFQSYGGGASSGWYVDEMTVETGPWPPLLVLPEGFEGGWGGWLVDYFGGQATDWGIWEIGNPTNPNGPATNAFGLRAYAGTNCAATGLTANYPNAGRTSRLISPPFVVPEAGLNPRLRFWHWWSFYSSDYGQVQIKGTNNVWQLLSGTYNTSSSGRWSRAWLDMGQYAGQTVQLGFYFQSYGGGASSGWYVDEMTVETGPWPPPLVLPEGFEGGWGGWLVDYFGGQATDWGIWEIGKPTNTNGPATNAFGLRAYAGTNCAATGLTSNYPNAGRTSRLISPSFVVPEAGLNPRLRFWHWWSFYSSDYGQVQIKGTNNVWQPLSGTYNTSSSGRWSRAWLDMGQYAGQTVQLGFDFQSYGGGANSGWYVDEMTVETGPWPPLLVLPEGFEGGWGGWLVDYFGGQATDWGIWEIGKPTNTNGPATNAFGLRARAGTNCAATGLTANYPNAGRTSRLISPSFVVPEAGLNPQLRFWHWWSFYGSSDYGQVQIKGTNNVWQSLSDKYTGNSAGVWGRPSPALDLAPYGGQTVQVGFYFQSYGGGANSGWYVDEIEILTTCAAILMQPPSEVQELGSPVTLCVTASGVQPLSYQWQLYGTNVVGATNACYTITNAQWSDQGPYDVVVNNSCGSVTSEPPAILLLFAVAPSITNQLTDQTVCAGTDALFTVGASGSPQLSYQWQFHRTNLPGATSASLLLTNVQANMSGPYRVVVTNDAGSATSGEALLRVLALCPPWTDQDIGDVGTPGSASYSNGIFTVQGSGEDIEQTEDSFHFAFQPWIGDGQIVAHLLKLQGGDPASAEAGVMIREGLDAGSKHAFLRVNAKTNIVFRRRLAFDDYSIENPYSVTNECWLRLMRMGNTFVAHCSTNGLNWEYVWFTTVNMSNQVQAGLAVTAHYRGSLATATFDNVSVGSLSPLTGPQPSPPRIYLGGEPLAYPELAYLGGFKMLLAGDVGDWLLIKSTNDVTAYFTNWHDLGTVTNYYGVVDFLDTQALTNSYRFYRAQRVGP